MARWISVALGLTLFLLGGLALIPRTLAQSNSNQTTRLDAFGDPLPDGAIARLGTQRWRFFECPLLFTSDGRLAVTAGYTLSLIDADSGRKLRTFDILSNSAFLMPDNKTLIVSGTWKKIPDLIEGLYFLDIETGKELRHLPIAGGACSWSADGKRMACSRRGERHHQIVEVWNLDTGKLLHTWAEAPGEPLLAPDGKSIAFRNRERTIICDVADGKECCRWESLIPNSGRTRSSKIFQFSPDGRMLACTEPRGVTLWDATTGRPLSKNGLPSLLKTTNQCADTLAFSADSRYLAVSGARGTVYIWNLSAGRLLHTIADAGRGLPTYALDFTADSKSLISQPHLFPSARIWDVASGKEVVQPGTNATKFDALTFSPDGTMIAANSPSDPVSLWDARTGKLLRRLPTHANVGLLSGTLTYLPSGKTLARGLYHYVSVWDLENGNLRYETRGNGPADMDTPGVDRQQLLFPHCSVDDETIVAVFPGEVKSVTNLERGGQFVSYWAMIGQFDLRTGKVIRSFQADADQFLGQLVLSPDRRTLVGQQAGQTVIGWDLSREVELFRFPFPGGWGGTVSFSADGRTLFLKTGQNALNDSKHVIYLYETASAKRRATFEYKIENHIPSRCAIDNERLCAITQGEMLQLFDLLTGKELARFKGDAPWIECLAFAPDGKTLASAGWDTTALVWDLSHMAASIKPIELAKEKLDGYWGQLRDEDAESAYQAVRILSQAPEQTTAYLSERLREVPPVSQETIRRLIRQLESDEFAERERASQGLVSLGLEVEPALAKVLKASPSLECTRRVERILQKLQALRQQVPLLSPDQLREIRALEVLERHGTRDAQAVLARLAKGSPTAVLTREAQTALQRLTNRLSKPHR